MVNRRRFAAHHRTGALPAAVTNSPLLADRPVRASICQEISRAEVQQIPLGWSIGSDPAHGQDLCLPRSQIPLCWRHPSPREKWRRWEAWRPQNPLQGSEVLIAHVGQIRSRIDLNRLGRFAVAAIKDGLCGRNASRRRGFRVLHDCGQGVDRVLRALAGGICDVAEYPSRLDRRWPLGPPCRVAALARTKACRSPSPSRHFACLRLFVRLF